MSVHSTLFALSWGLLSMAPLSANDPPQLLPVYGGSGGTAFTRGCGAGKVLTGLRYRDGLLVDAVGILCRPVRSDGTLGSESTAGTIVGGSGGNAGSASCDAGYVITSARIRHGSYVNSVRISCRQWTASTRTFGGITKAVTDNIAGNPTASAGARDDTETCESSRQPANGIRGRAQSLVDAIGFICDEP